MNNPYTNINSIQYLESEVKVTILFTITQVWEQARENGTFKYKLINTCASTNNDL